MPKYDYHCDANGQTHEAVHSWKESISTWGELCALMKINPGTTPKESPVHKLISSFSVSVPAGNSKLKNMGFTKLVKRDKGVYENVTATDKEKRFVVSGQNDSLPNFKRKITD